MAALCALVLAACSTDVELAQTNLTSSHIHVGTFPSFGEAQTRSVGTFDAGKTEWADGDAILVKFSFTNNTVATGVITYDGAAWSWTTPVKQVTDVADITAYYAPAYEWSNDTPSTLVLKSGKTAGTDEYLVYTATGVPLAKGISINFSKTVRTYSRLRVAVVPNITVTLTAANFTPVGTTTALGAGTLTATTDAKGNAYFYGSWTVDTQISVSIDGSPAISKTIATASATGRSYALEPELMRFTINNSSTDASFSIPFPTGGTTPAKIIVDWGDGTKATIPAETTLSTGDAFDHTYSSTGDFTITIVSFQSDNTQKQIPRFDFYSNRRTNSNETKVKSMDTPLLNTAETDFAACFSSCSNLVTISAGLFDKNTEVTHFTSCFLFCENLTTIPAGLFDKNTKATDFSGCFQNCNNLTTIPTGLFGKNTEVTNFAECFSGCTNLKLNENIFIDGTTTTAADRFNQVAASIDFSDCFAYCGLLRGGTAPALWSYTFNSTPTTTGCFSNVTNVTNVADIPDEWK